VRRPDVRCSRGGPSSPSDRMASTCCSVVGGKMGSAGLTGRDGPGRVCLAPSKERQRSSNKGVFASEKWDFLARTMIR